MTTLVANNAFDMIGLLATGSLSEFFDFGVVETGTETSFVVNYSEPGFTEKLTLTGTFTNYVNGYPTSGSITGVTYAINGANLFTLTSVAITVEAFRAYVDADNLVGLFSDVLSGADTLTGSSGDDSLLGFDGNDTIAGNDGDDFIDGGAGDDILRGGFGNDEVRGGDGNDFMTELSGNVGPFGDDIYDGGAGIDRVSMFTENGPGVTIDLRITTAQNTGSMGVDTFIGIEHITANYGDDTLIGDDNANFFWTFSGFDQLSGNGGDDLFTVGLGTKIIDGGAGSDTVEILDLAWQPLYTANGITVSLELQGFAQQTGVGDWVLTGIENLAGSFGSDRFTGDSNANILAGESGDDTLIGGGGNDILAGDGTFTLETSFSGNIVFLEQTSGANGNDFLDGGDGDDRLIGGGGNDVLIGGMGTDLLEGGDGIDTASYADAASRVQVSLGLATSQNTLGAGMDTLTGIENLTGSAFNDTLSGNALDNVIDGGLGNDQMFGGLGNDTYIVDSLSDRIGEVAGGGTDTVLSSVSYLLATNVENLTLTGNAWINATGNASDNRLVGNGGTNVLNGLAGADVMEGMGGDDFYVVDNSGDVVIEAADGGKDIVYTSVDYTLSDNVESGIINTTAAINLTGNALANSLTGSDGMNTLDGKAGADFMYGGLGNDTYIADNIGDRIGEIAEGGIDTVIASVSFGLGTNIENLVLTGTANINAVGNGLANELTGNAGANGILGGLGRDVMTGGGGADRFIFNAVNETGTSAATADVITDFSQVEGDRIQLLNIDANTTIAGNQAFAFIGTGAFTGTAGELRYEQVDGNTLVSGDTNGDGVADFLIQLNGGYALVEGDFYL